MQGFDVVTGKIFEDQIAVLSDDELFDLWTSVPGREGSSPREKEILAEMERRGSWALDRFADHMRD